MKKVCTIIFAALCAAAFISCNKEVAKVDNPQQEVTNQEQTLLNPVTLTFTADPSTKIAIDGEGRHASWEEGDKIKIASFDTEGTPKYVKDIEVEIDAEGNGTFTAEVESSDVYYAVYPSAATVALERVNGEDKLKVTIAAKQNGTFKKACYYAAKTTKDAKKFNFKAISGIIKFQADPSYKKVDIRNVEQTSSRHALAQAETCTFDTEGNVTVAPVANIGSTISIALDGNGTYYAAVCGNAVNEVAFRFSKDAEDTPEESKLGFEPGVYYNNLVTFEPAHIKNYGKLTDKIVTDVYVAPEAQGNGDGLSAANAAPAADLIDACIGNPEVKYTAVKGLFKYTGGWNCFRMDGLTIHFADGEYTDKFTVAGNLSSFVVTLDGSADAIQKGGIVVTATCEGTVTKINGMTFTAATGLSVSNGNCEVTGCTFKGCTTRAAAIGGKEATDNSLKVNFKNCLFSANTCASQGVVNVPDASTGGILGFNNCRFENNIATNGNASAIYTAKGKTAIFLNKCTFMGNKCTTPANAYTIGTNDAVTRFAMNCCTVNTGYHTTKNSSDKDVVTAWTNGSAITLKGQSVIVNSTVWTSKWIGGWGLVSLGSLAESNSSNSAAIINSVIRNNTTTYPAVYLNAKYYQNLKYCLHQGKDLTVDNSKHTVENTVKVSAFDDPGPNEKIVDGIKAYFYTWNYSNTIGESGFEKPSATDVRNAIAAVGESATGEKDGLGGLFLKWLDSVDENAFSKDITGKARPAEGLCPGSYEN